MSVGVSAGRDAAPWGGRAVAAALWRTLLQLAALGGLAGVAAGFLGAVHPAFDAFSHFRAHGAGVALVAGLLLVAGRGGRGAGAVAAAAGVAALATVMPFLVPRNAVPVAPDAPTLTLLQMNVLLSSDLAPAIDMIRTLKPDVVTLQEVTREKAGEVSVLTEYQQVRCDMGWRIGGTMILSRTPMVGSTWCAPDGRTTIQAVEQDGRAVTIVATHLRHPWPRKQAEDVAMLTPQLEALAGPVVVGGDFNAAPWSETVRTYARVSGTRPVEGVGFTWPHGFGLPDLLTEWVGLPIDNVLTSPDVGVVAASRPGATASDHLPVLVRLTIDTAGDAPVSVAEAR